MSKRKRSSDPKPSQMPAEQTEPSRAKKRASEPEPKPLESASSEQPANRRRGSGFALGASLYPLDSESQGPDDWYQRDQAEDLSAMKEAGFALARVFVSWKQIEPQVGQYDALALARLGAVVIEARERAIRTIVCLFADDRHADLVDLAWARRRNPCSDVYLLQREVALVAQVAATLRDEPGVFGWQLANEAFCAGFSSSAELEEWTRLMREAIREVDPDRPITLGIDAETFFSATGVDARAAIATCEFAVSHITSAYRAYAAEGPATSGPATYLDAFLLRLADRDKPVLADDVGPLSLEGSPAEEAAALRTALWSGLANRASGALVRRFRDFETERREPYFLDPFETLVGITDTDGTPKPAFDEAGRFLAALADADLRGLEPTPERTAIILPAERYEPLPNLARLFDPRAALSAFIGAKEAHVPTTLAEESDDLAGYSVVIVPSAFRLGKKTWTRLSSFVQAGGSLILSYGGGDAHPAMREIFGIEPLGDAGASSRMTCRVAQQDALGSLADFDVRFDIPNYASLGGGSATIVATDSNGSPLLSVNQFGKGRAVYIAVPLERAIAQGDPWTTPPPVRRLLREVYGAVARAAGCGAPVDCSVPEVELTLFQGEAEDLLVLLNHAPAALSADITTTRSVVSITDVRGTTSTDVSGTRFSVRMGANGAVALRLAYS